MENVLAWHVWLYAGLALLIIELFTPGFVAACIGIGCLIAAPIAYADMAIEWQLTVFAASTLLSLFALRPIVLRKFYQSSDKVKTNADSLVGKTAKVTQEIGPADKLGRASVDGDSFMAKSANGETLAAGTIATVNQLDSTILILKKL